MEGLLSVASTFADVAILAYAGRLLWIAKSFTFAFLWH